MMRFRLTSSLLALTLLACANRDSAGAARTADAATLQPSSLVPGDSANALLAKADAGRILGDPKASVWLIIISDFQCPYCRQWHAESWEAIRKEYVETGRIRVAYVNLPLEMHPNAMPAAQVAMCAAVQGKFWPVQDAIFRTQKAWKDLADAQPFFEKLAGDAGANVDTLRACVTSKATRPLIQGDIDRAMRAGAQSTPTFFVGGQPMIGAQPLAAFRGAIEAALATKPAAKPAAK